MKQAFNKKVCPQEWDLVQEYYLFKQALGAKRFLITKDDDELTRPVNTDAVKKYFV